MRLRFTWAASAGIATAAAAVVGPLSVLSERNAEASISSRLDPFVRPDFTQPPPAPQLDLTRDWSLADRELLVELSGDPQICRDALDAVGVRYSVLPDPPENSVCGIENGVRTTHTLAAFNGPQAMNCALAARLYVWELQSVIPAAERRLGSPVVGIKSLGSFSCRRVGGDGPLSEHAFGKAADIAAFTLADGRTISVKEHFWSKGPEGMFLREIHRQACELFDVTLGPAFNADHHDHFHLDVGGDSACR